MDTTSKENGFVKIEKNIIDYWDSHDVVKKYLQKNSKSKKIFSFLDGPITANNPMGVHHAWGRTYKDLWQRYFNMKGYRQRFQNGFDCQGLWVEVEVEKELGIRNKKDIENLVPGDKKKSIDKFVKLCKQRVKKYSDIQTQQSKRLGYFMDWENSYFTLSENNNYMIWHFLKVCHENGWVYKGSDVVPWCPRCETAISQHEILTEDYRDVVHKSVYFRLPIKGRKNEYLLVWTTTPWTIPANSAVAVDKNYEYSLVEESDGKKYWIGSELIKNVITDVNYKVVDKIKGREMEDWKYSSAFDDLPYVKGLSKEELERFHRVVLTDNLIMPITLEEGTGLVHTSTSTGEEDHKLGKKLNIPVCPAIDDRAFYLETMGYLKGLNAKEKPEIVINLLSEKGFLYKIYDYKHRYPACWRCKNELVWKLTDEWYISMDTISKSKIAGRGRDTLRNRMIKVAKSIKWIPGFGLERELDWLNNMHDWLISKKNRYWGLALPIWECECGHFEVIGSNDELKKKALKGFDLKGKTPHKPQIDDVVIKCIKCGSNINRIESVGNPWLDAGIVAFSTISKNNKACLFSDSSEQPLYLSDKNEWRKWYPADFITESFPGQFKNWFYSLIAMSTVLENESPFKTVLGFATLLDEKGSPMHKSSGNMIEFNKGAEEIGADVMRMIYLRQNPNDNLLFGFGIADELRRKFFIKLENVYNYFSVYADIDSWHKSTDDIVSKRSSNVLDSWIIERLSTVVQNIESNLERYDAASSVENLELFVDDLSNWYIRRSRNRTGNSSENSKDKNDFYSTLCRVLMDFSKIMAPFFPFYGEHLYLKMIQKQPGFSESVHLCDWPEYKKIFDKDTLENMDLIRKYAEKIHSLRKSKNIPVRQPLLKVKIESKNIPGIEFEELLKDEINVKNIEWIKNNGTKIDLDTKIYPDLLEEAKTRELIRKIQNKRKEMGISLTQSIIVVSDWYPQNKDMIEKIQTNVLAKELREGEFDVISE